MPTLRPGTALLVRAVLWIASEQVAILLVDSQIQWPTAWSGPTLGNFLAAWLADPRWTDEDLFVTNWIMHPLMGAHFYMVGRNHGLDVRRAVLLTIFGSLSWEWLAEAWFLLPVVQDALVTVVLGVPVAWLVLRLKEPLRRLPKRGLRGLLILPLDPLEGTDTLLFDGPPVLARG